MQPVVVNPARVRFPRPGGELLAQCPGDAAVRLARSVRGAAQLLAHALRRGGVVREHREGALVRCVLLRLLGGLHDLRGGRRAVQFHGLAQALEVLLQGRGDVGHPARDVLPLLLRVPRHGVQDLPDLLHRGRDVADHGHVQVRLVAVQLQAQLVAQRVQRHAVHVVLGLRPLDERERGAGQFRGGRAARGPVVRVVGLVAGNAIERGGAGIQGHAMVEVGFCEGVHGGRGAVRGAQGCQGFAALRGGVDVRHRVSP